MANSYLRNHCAHINDRAQANLSSKIFNSILEHAADNGGHRAVAMLMGVDYFNWYNALNRNRNPIHEDAAKLAIYIQATRNAEPLRLIAETCNYTIQPRQDVEIDDHDLRHEAAELNQMAGDLGMQIDEALEDGSVSPKEEKEFSQAIQEIRNQCSEMEAKIKRAGK